MNRLDEFNYLMEKSGATPYRKYGHIRVSFAKSLPSEVTGKVIAAIKALAPRRGKFWKYPDPETIQHWMNEKFTSYYVCDDPPPVEVDLEKITPQEIIDLCRRYDFNFVLESDTKFKGVANDGHSMEVIKKFLPKWFINLTIKHYQSIIEVLKQPKSGD